MTSVGAPVLTDAARAALAELLLALADDEFVIGFWDSEWTGIAPMLEEDVAMSSISQDEIRHARALYELPAELTDADADAIAFGRAAAEFRHAALLNHARTDWAFTIARRFLYESADAVRLEALARSSYQPLANLAAKMRREEGYHRMHIDTWLRRLAGGPGAQRLHEALDRAWPDAQALFTPLAGEQELVRSGILADPFGELHRRWAEHVTAVLGELGIGLAPAAVPADGRTRRTEDFAWLHGQFTMVAASEAGATW
ncbi:MAG TPA: 1,2-phenylacetyl-CoA epoxidase subunit PaaC [Candidatus Limnocylindria bacterium]|nr:1,2-phenylacetyl-CoA epoxidase subunit PaaC [Candidatus Limnocylindria bacterium]